MTNQEAVAALDKAIVKLNDMAENDEDMTLALEVVQAERAEAEYDGAFAEFGGANAEPKEPVRKEIAALGAGGLTLIVAYVAGLAGLEMPPEVAAAIAAIVAAGAGYLKGESYLLPDQR